MCGERESRVWSGVVGSRREGKGLCVFLSRLSVDGGEGGERVGLVYEGGGWCVSVERVEEPWIEGGREEG